MIGINKRKKYAMCFLCALVLLISIIKVYGLYNKYSADKDTRRYIVVIIQKLGEDESKVRYLVKLKSDSFILNIYKESSFGKIYEGSNFSNYIYGDELKVSGKIVKSQIYGNPR